MFFPSAWAASGGTKTKEQQQQQNGGGETRMTVSAGNVMEGGEEREEGEGRMCAAWNDCEQLQRSEQAAAAAAAAARSLQQRELRELLFANFQRQMLAQLFFGSTQQQQQATTIQQMSAVSVGEEGKEKEEEKEEEEEEKEKEKKLKLSQITTAVKRPRLELLTSPHQQQTRQHRALDGGGELMAARSADVCLAPTEVVSNDAASIAAAQLSQMESALHARGFPLPVGGLAALSSEQLLELATVLAAQRVAAAQLQQAASAAWMPALAFQSIIAARQQPQQQQQQQHLISKLLENQQANANK